MVLFKRKGVSYLSRPPVEDDAEDVWVIPQTGEVFTTYESYLQRMDWYKQKRFTCEVSGRSGLSFFDALRSELAGSREVDQAFPEPLKHPVLRRVQFSTTSRIDNLVDEVFDDFKNDFFPGETVTVLLDNGERLSGNIRDKAKFGPTFEADGTLKSKPFSRYFVSLTERPDEEALADNDHVTRDRKIFTKQMLRSFIKNCVTREAWTGAPWLVKDDLAQKYFIPQEVPLHLQHGYKVAQRKAQRKAEQQAGMRKLHLPLVPQVLTHVSSGRKVPYTPDQIYGMQQQGTWDGFQAVNPNGPAFAPIDHMHWQPGMPPPPGHPGFMPFPPNGFPPNMPPNIAPKAELPIPMPPPIKYPTDDMDIPPVRDGVHRPLLKFVAESQVTKHMSSEYVIPGMSEPTIGLLLEIWNTLNVYCQVLLLDSFTFDDFVDAMQFSSDEIDCDLLVEVHCAVLKKLANPENEQNGALQISLPDLPDPSDDEDEDEEDGTREPTPEPEVPAKRTRSSLNKVQFAYEQEAESADTKVHRAAEMFGEYGWLQRLRKRDFRNGGWEMVLVGLLHQVAGRPRLTETCNRILAHLAPLDAEPTIQTVQLQYSTMDINLRAEAMQIITQLFLETKTVKTFLEDMSNTMTEFRKVKISHQRERKDALAKLKNLQIERRLLAPTPEKSPTPMPELEDGMNGVDLANGNKTEEDENSVPDSEDEEPITTRSLRRNQDRLEERKRKREEETERKIKEAEAKQNKGSKEYQKVLKQIEKEEQRVEEAEYHIANVDADLREADCPRTRVLGKDRFCNRYWWFERNAMPHGGLPDSSTYDAGYANGRIWVQGPDDMERLGYIDVPEQDKKSYFAHFQMTPEERKKLEEGETQLHTANQWGFYDSPEEVDALIGWLDSRGLREIKLKKELTLQRDVIVERMEARKADLAPREVSEEPTTRMSTRTKTYISEASHRCLRWKNTTAWAEQGHNHVDPPPQAVKRGRAKKVVPEETQTRSKTRRDDDMPVVLNRQGKPVTRQGGRYNF
jgi:hypothetical protein